MTQHETQIEANAPSSFPDVPVCLCNPPRTRDEEGKGKVCRRIGQNVRSVTDVDTPFGGLCHVDVLVSDAARADHFQGGSPKDDLLVDPVSRYADESIHIPYAFEQFFRVERVSPLIDGYIARTSPRSARSLATVFSAWHKPSVSQFPPPRLFYLI